MLCSCKINMFFHVINCSIHLFIGDPKKSEHLLALDGAKERLHLFKAELLDEGAFDSVVDGCIGVFHTASPFYHNIKDPQVLFFLSLIAYFSCLVYKYLQLGTSILILYVVSDFLGCG